jgi:hypothetical protein
MSLTQQQAHTLGRLTRIFACEKAMSHADVAEFLRRNPADVQFIADAAADLAQALRELPPPEEPETDPVLAAKLKRIELLEQRCEELELQVLQLTGGDETAALAEIEATEPQALAPPAPAEAATAA